MKRRHFLYGLGAATAGSSVLIGSGAFTVGSLEDREFDIDVVNDDAGVIRLVDMLPDSDVVAEDEKSGRFGIDFTAGGAHGVNTGGRFQLGGIPDGMGEGGELEESYWPQHEFGYAFAPEGSPNAAFGIENLATQTYDLTIEYELDDRMVEAAVKERPLGDAKLEFYVFNGNLYGFPHEHTIDSPSFTIHSSNPKDSVTIDESYPEIRQFSPEKRIFVSMAVDTQDVENPEYVDLSGTMRISADNARGGD